MVLIELADYTENCAYDEVFCASHDQTARCGPFNLDSLRCSSEDPGGSRHIRLREYPAEDVLSR